MLTFILIIIVVALCLFLIKDNSETRPVINTIDPPVGSAGDILTISGSDFGLTRGDSFVEIGESRLTMSSYIEWSDNLIRVVLPQTVQDGLVTVVTTKGVSEPKVFANKSVVPVVVPPNPLTALPKISSINKNSAVIGEMITISGINFGAYKNTSSVTFSTNIEASVSGQNQTVAERISCSESDYDYEFWSDQEIRVRVPDGAISGEVSVVTDKGESSPYKINISSPIGSMVFSDGRTYLVNSSVDIADAEVTENATLTLRVPFPPVSAMQRSVEMTQCSPEPVITDYLNTIVHQLSIKKIVSEKQPVEFQKKAFNHTFVITVYGVSTSVKSKQVSPFAEKTRLIYTVNTRADALIKSDDENVIALARKIVGKTTNPYNQALLIYNYLLDNYKLLENQRSGGSDPLDLLNSAEGDAYDFAILYCTLLRASGIPAVPVSGILVDSVMQSVPHWWCEFYIEKFGWIPVDTALGAGMKYASFKEKASVRDFYFGNIDAQHIAFSRGWNVVKPALVNSKTVYRPRTYALQSIWEEGSEGITRYSSYWTDASVSGIY